MEKGQSVWKIVFGSVLICLVVFSLSFAVGHQTGFVSGSAEGYNIGYSEGYDNGHQIGYSEGNIAGYNSGYAQGYDNGYDNGYATGFQEGYTIGYENGVNSVLMHGYVLHDPTYDEMKDFIARDKTDAKLYRPNNYTCVNFSADVKKNAAAENIRCAFVYLEFSDSAHAIVAFNTIDRGLIYIEPQTDEEVNVSVGSFYENNQSWGTITRAIVIW